MIYFSSDLHFGHARDFMYGPRGFNNVNDHDAEIVKRWNSIVKDEDEVYCLGDIMLNDNKNGIKLWNQLKGNKHIIPGNHDSTSRIKLYKKCPNTIVEKGSISFRYEKYNFYLSHYPSLCSHVAKDKPLYLRTICLCGHTHTNDKFVDMDKGLIYHVEVDAHNLYPVDIKTILNDLKEFYNEK